MRSRNPPFLFTGQADLAQAGAPGPGREAGGAGRTHCGAIRRAGASGAAGAHFFSIYI